MNNDICDEDEMIELIEQRVLAETTEKQMNNRIKMRTNTKSYID